MYFGSFFAKPFAPFVLDVKEKLLTSFWNQMMEITDQQELDFAALALFSKHPEMPGVNIWN